MQRPALLPTAWLSRNLFSSVATSSFRQRLQRFRNQLFYFEYLLRYQARDITGAVGRLVPPSTVLSWLDRSVYRHVRAERCDPDGSVKPFKDVYLEVRSRCNSSCSFCRASRLYDDRPDVSMSQSLYLDIIGQLESAGLDGILSFHCMNEPLLHPNLVEFVRIARKRLPNATLRILTNGRKLTWPLTQQLVAAGIDIVTITTYLEDICGPLPNNLREILRRSEGWTGADNPWKAKWKIGTTQFKIERQRMVQSRENLGSVSPDAIVPRKAYWGLCEFPLRSIFVSADGRLAKCTWDFGFMDVMGTLAQNSLEQIWRNEKYTELRSALLRNDRSGLPNCRACNFPGQCGRNSQSSLLERLAVHFVPRH